MGPDDKYGEEEAEGCDGVWLKADDGRGASLNGSCGVEEAAAGEEVGGGDALRLGPAVGEGDRLEFSGDGLTKFAAAFQCW